RAALRLLVLTAAEGTPGDQVNAFVGMAQAAFTAGLPAVVATQGVMAPAAADAFDRAFYTALAEGLSLERCMADARQAVLRATGGAGVDWALPALFSQLEDGVLWEIAPAAPHEPADRPPAAVLDNLPPPEPLPFSGRDEPLRTLRRLLGPGEGAVRIQLVGEGGSGRSALAYHAAREALERSRADPGGPEAFHAVIRVSARHGSPALSGSLRRQSPWSMDDLYAAVAAVLGKPGMSEVRPEERMAVLREVLQGGRHLLVLDDVDLVADRRRDELLRALQPPNKAVLVCRTPLAVADEEVQVPPLEPESAAALLLADAAGARAEAVLRATPEERLALARLAGGLPFVLRWAVARLREPDARIDAVTRLLANADGEPLAEYCVRTSVDALDEEARVLLLAFALYPQPTTPEAAAAAAGPGFSYDEARERLIRLRLLRPADAPGRYRPILRARRYAQELLEDEKQRVFRECAVQRAIDFIQVAAQRDVERLAGEVGNVIWAALRAYEAERWAVLVEFRRRLDDFLYRRGHFNEALLLGDRAFDAADRLGDRTERAWCALYPLARVHQGQGSVEEARRWSGRALALFEQEDNHFGQAMACRELGRLLQAEGDAVRAEALFRRGVEHARRYDREADHFKLQARMQVGLAEITREQRRWSEAEPLYRDALDLYRRAADEGGIAATLHALATLALERGNERAAEALLAESLSVLKDPRRREVRSARVWVTQALLADGRGDGAGAQALLRRAREVL
ncbi:MAG TPA: tetratricopeptide repeat protein, partial [Longimicrobium sp.]|nr:tetratricopeptide repeat protein [Longimicrobium sp.]